MCVKKDSSYKILRVCNSYDDNLNFTYELEMNNKLNFFNVMLLKENGKVITNMYQKPTNTGRILNFNF